MECEGGIAEGGGGGAECESGVAEGGDGRAEYEGGVAKSGDGVERNAKAEWNAKAA